MSNLSTKSDRNWIDNDIEPVFQQVMRDTAKDVASLKVLAFTFPEVLPAHLRWFWVAKVLATIPRLLMTGKIITPDKFTYSDANQVLALFFSPEEMSMPVEAAKELVSDKKMKDFKIFLRRILDREPLIEQERCIHRQSVFRKMFPFSSPFCDPCLDQDKADQRIKNTILTTMMANNFDANISVTSCEERSITITGKAMGQGGGIKRKTADEAVISASKIPKK